MWVWAGTNGILGRNSRTQLPPDGQKENRSSRRMDPTQESHRSSKIPRIHWLLLLLHKGLLKNSSTAIGSHQESIRMDMGSKAKGCLWNPETMNVQRPSPHPTKLQTTLLLANRCIQLWCGSHTLARGRDQWPNRRGITCSKIKTKITSNCILLGNIHSNWKELRHIRTGAASSDESPFSLATIPGMNNKTLCDPHRPCEPTILEGPTWPKPTNRKMAHRPSRIWLSGQIYPWEGKHAGWCVIKAGWNRHWRTGQQRSHHDSTITMQDSPQQYRQSEANHDGNPWSSDSRSS